MDFRFVLGVYVMIVGYVSVRSDDPESQEDPIALILQEVYDLQGKFQQRGKETRAHVDERFDGLIEEIQENVGKKLQHISEVVDAIERRFKLAELCPPGICGDNGACDIADNPQGYECICDSTHHGANCELEYGPCEAKLAEMKARPLMPGMELPRCDEQGYYLGMQFRGAMAICFTREGEEIHNYSVRRWETGDNMDCQCARDELENAYTGKAEKLFSCSPNGNYAQVACDKENCWCQNALGQQYGGQHPIGELDVELHC